MISVTLLSACLYCSRKLYLERVLKIVEPPKEALLRGKIRHKVIEEASKKEEEIVSSIKKKLSFEETKDLYRNTYASILRQELVKNKKELSHFKLDSAKVFSDMLKGFDPQISLRAGNVHDFIEKHNLFGEELWLELTPKIKSEIRVESEKLGLIGIIDQLHVYPDKLIPFELKTGKAPAQGVWPGNRIQIAAYLLLLEEKFGKDMEKGFIKYLDSDSTRPIVMNPLLKKEVEDLVAKVNNVLSSGKAPDFCGNENKCNACGIKKECFAL